MPQPPIPPEDRYRQWAQFAQQLAEGFAALRQTLQTAPPPAPPQEDAA